MESILVVALFFGCGLVCRQLGLPKDVGQNLSKYLVFIALPCLTLLTVQQMEATSELLIPTLAIWFTIVAGILYFWSFGWLLGLPRQMIGAMIMAAAFSNTAFVGIPIVDALAGEEYTGLAVWLDQAGSYLALNTIGLLVAVMTSPTTENRPSLGLIAKRIAAFPPFWAMVAAVILRPWEYPDVVLRFLTMGAESLVPVALVAVGLQLDVRALRGHWLPLGSALFFGLIIAPALALLVFVAGTEVATGEMKVTVLEAAMGPQIGASVVALQYKLEPGLVAGIVGIGIPLSLLTTSAWWWLMTWPINT